MNYFEFKKMWLLNRAKPDCFNAIVELSQDDELPTVSEFNLTLETCLYVPRKKSAPQRKQEPPRSTTPTTPDGGSETDVVTDDGTNDEQLSGKDKMSVIAEALLNTAK